MVDMVVMSTHPRPLVRKPYIIIIKYNLFQNCYRLFIVCITQTDQVVQSWLLTCTKTSANKSSNWKSYNMAHLVTQKIFSNLRPGVFQTGMWLVVHKIGSKRHGVFYLLGFIWSYVHKFETDMTSLQCLGVVECTPLRVPNPIHNTCMQETCPCTFLILYVTRTSIFYN